MLDLFSTIDVLTVQETSRKAELEATIERGMQTFVEVGLALMEIRDERLYRDEFRAFEEYCRVKWGWLRDRSDKLIASAKVVSNLHSMEGILPNNERQVRPLAPLAPDLQREAWREAVGTAPNGKVTAAHVQAVVDRMTQPEPSKERANQAMGATVYSHNSLDYYTPRYVTDAARAVMGGIDLDPASCEMAQAWIRAGRYYTIADDGLAQPWAGRVWLNPPYSYTDGRSNQDMWSERLITEYLQGDVTEGLLLVKAALGYKWFERLWDTWPVCFMRDRLSFVMADGSDDGQSKQATAIFYIGNNVSKFVDVFRTLGRVILPENQYRD